MGKIHFCSDRCQCPHREERLSDDKVFRAYGRDLFNNHCERLLAYAGEQRLALPDTFFGTHPSVAYCAPFRPQTPAKHATVLTTFLLDRRTVGSSAMSLPADHQCRNRNQTMTSYMLRSTSAVVLPPTANSLTPPRSVELSTWES